MSGYTVNDTVTLKLKTTLEAPTVRTKCRVLGVYRKYYLLNNGKYNFCAFKSDVHNDGAIILM